MSYACKCLNIRIKPSDQQHSHVVYDPVFEPVFIDQDGISIVSLCTIFVQAPSSSVQSSRTPRSPYGLDLGAFQLVAPLNARDTRH